jgi:hypothetical protein
VDLLLAPDAPSAWRVPATLASPYTRIITALVPVKETVTPLAMVRDWKASTSMLGPPLWVTVCGAGSVCEHVAPLHVLPLKVTVPAQLRFTAAAGVMPESDVSPVGV